MSAHRAGNDGGVAERLGQALTPVEAIREQLHALRVTMEHAEVNDDHFRGHIEGLEFALRALGVEP